MKSSVTHTKDFSEKNAPQSPDFGDFFLPKLPYLDNKFHQVAKIWQDS
jgi:hypothetical protein